MSVCVWILTQPPKNLFREMDENDDALVSREEFDLYVVHTYVHAVRLVTVFAEIVCDSTSSAACADLHACVHGICMRMFSHFEEDVQQPPPSGLWERQDADKNGVLTWQEFEGPKGTAPPQPGDQKAGILRAAQRAGAGAGAGAKQGAEQQRETATFVQPVLDVNLFASMDTNADAFVTKQEMEEFFVKATGGVRCCTLHLPIVPTHACQNTMHLFTATTHLSSTCRPPPNTCSRPKMRMATDK